MNQIKENKNSFGASFKPMWHKIKTWSYLEFNNFQLIVQMRGFQNDVFRSSYRKCSVKIGVLKHFVNFTGKQLCWSLFFKNLQASSLLRTY